MLEIKKILRSICLPANAAILSILLAACSEELRDADFTVRDFGNGEPHSACTDNNPLRNAYFGDLHVHTEKSTDAWMFGVRVSPDDAYRYAFGGTVQLNVPVGSDRPDQRLISNPQPLDFMAVTDHAEFLGEIHLCTNPFSRVRDSGFCRELLNVSGRSMKQVIRIMLPFPLRDSEVCGEQNRDCAKASMNNWQQIIATAERWQDRSSSCERTTLIGYEYSSHRLGSNLHRNIIFRNSKVISRPISYLEKPREWDLWQLLDVHCLQSDTGCDVMSIPHNSNISNGRMFAVDWPGTSTRQERRQRAELRARLEPVVEIFQHKGDSECRVQMPGILGDDDPLCGFERFEDMSFVFRKGKELENICYSGPGADSVPHLGPDCISHLSYARYALIEGLRQQQLLGINPYKFGLLGSTDTHNGIGGATDERTFPGHLGQGDDTIAKRTALDSSAAGNSANNPGGLVGVWAEENSREAIFSALRRREVFGTSGTRIRPRFFAGWQYPEQLCDSPQRLQQAYADGVPMGGTLPDPNWSGSPMFISWAVSDPGTSSPGALLQRIQIIKGWLGKDGQLHQKVYEIAGDSDSKHEPDKNSCQPSPVGFKKLCSVWQDPDFDGQLPAVYYARVLEQPSCRYNTWQCQQLPEDQRPASCSEEAAVKTVQERAWTSPIWYQPPTNPLTARDN